LEERNKMSVNNLAAIFGPIMMNVDKVRKQSFCYILSCSLWPISTDLVGLYGGRHEELESAEVRN